MTMGRSEFLMRADIESATLEIWIERRWIIPIASAQGAAFGERDVERALLIRDLSGDFGVNDEGVDLVLHLSDQLRGMRLAMAELKARLGEPT